MPEINLIRDTQSPDQPPKRPRKPGDPELTDPSHSGGLGQMFRSFLGRAPKAPAPTPGPDRSRMGLGKSKPDQRIINEKRKAPPTTVIPLPEDDSSGFDVNLLSEDLLSKFNPRAVLLSLLAWIVGAAALVGLAFFGLSLAERSITTQIDETKSQLADVRRTITGLEDQQLLIANTKQKIDAIQSLIDNHVRWTKFFDKLERYTLPNVFYGTTFNADIQGSLTLSARTDSFTSVAAQYLVYEQAVAAGDFISSFEITGATRGRTEDGQPFVSFTVSMQVLPTVFKNTLDNLDAGDLTDQVSRQLEQFEASLQATQDFLLGLCAIRTSPSDLNFIPVFDQVNISRIVANLQNADCQNATETDLNRVQTLIRTDQDADGLNLLYENLLATSDSQADTDGDGATDYAEASLLASRSGT